MEMGPVQDEINLGQLCREHFRETPALIGFGTHHGNGCRGVGLGQRDGGESHAAVA
jgi:erythromycin esterase-like protein